MSADNGIYVAKFPDGYRVIHAQAIDNLDYYPKNSQEYVDTVRQYFNKSKIYQTQEEAFAEADKMAKECWFLEYGICDLGEFQVDMIPSTDNVKLLEEIKELRKLLKDARIIITDLEYRRYTEDKDDGLCKYCDQFLNHLPECDIKKFLESSANILNVNNKRLEALDKLAAQAQELDMGY